MKLACENLTVSYKRHPAIHHLSCEFKLNATNAIIGPNGAGKSTLLKALVGELKPETGNVIQEGIYAKDIAYLPQIVELDYSLSLTVEEVVLLGLWHEIGLCGGVKTQDLLKVNQNLAEVGLSGFNKRYVHELSRGQLQRVLFARVLMQNASIILLDEPFNAVDAKTIDDLLKLIVEWKNRGKTIIAVLHDLSQVLSTFEYTLLLAKDLITYAATKQVLTKENLQQAYSSNLVWSNNLDICDTI